MQMTERPESIEQILQTICELIDSESYAAFEIYLSNLEEKQGLHNTERNSVIKWDIDNPPIWSHQRKMERARKRRARVLQKLNMHQK